MWFGLLAAIVCGCTEEDAPGAPPDAEDADQDGYSTDDCDDDDASVHPGAEEACNNLDDDCDDRVDEELYCTWYPDADGDGYGVTDGVVEGMPETEGYVDRGGDCDDANSAIHPGAAELCNGVDEDCDGDVGEEDDDDRDGFAECEGDCDDGNSQIGVGAVEFCDGLDDDCDGVLAADEADLDGDGEPLCAGDCDDSRRTLAHRNLEVCDGLDNNCSGETDEDCQGCDVAVPNDHDTVQWGIDSAMAGDTVCVGPGTWYEHVTFNGATITLLGVEGPGATILDGEGSEVPVVRFDSAETADTEMRGFTVQNGGDGGIAISDASPTLTELWVEWNAGDLGGGVTVEGGGATMTQVLIYGNTSSAGGGLYVSESELVLDRVVIQGNLADDAGGGIYASDSAIEALDLELTSNHSYTAGGAYLDGSTVDLTNALVDNNYAAYWVAGLYVADSTLWLDNVHVYGNQTDWGGASGVELHSSTAALVNSTVAFNFGWHSAHGGVAGAGFTFSHSDIYGNTPDNFYGVSDPTGTNGNLSVDPDLYHYAGHLNTTSPLIDAGDPTILDPDGSPSDIGPFGGPGADDWDSDGDGYFSWWLPGAYDPARSPGTDCNDQDATVYPGAGC